MADYVRMFARVVQFLRFHGVDVKFARGSRVSDDAIRLAQEQLTIPLPESIVELYREVGDGFSLFWNDGKPVPPTPEQQLAAEQLSTILGKPFKLPALCDGNVQGGVEFSPLAKLVARHLDRARWATEFKQGCDFPHVEDRQLAGRTAEHMRRWFGFHDEGNGDRFCIDTGAEPQPVVFDQHDWFDGGTGENGGKLGSTLWEFLDQWSRVCFQDPSSLWWPSVLTQSGINWDSDEFDPKFRLPLS